MLAAAIVSLFHRCRPATIAQFITALIVDAVNALALWPLTHVRKEVREALAPLPAVAYPDTASAVILPTDVFRVGATLNHHPPGIAGGSLVFRPPLARVNAPRCTFGLSVVRPVFAIVDNQRFPVAFPIDPFITGPTQAIAMMGKMAAGGGLASINSHRETSFPGVRRADVSASRPLNFTIFEASRGGGTACE